MSTLKSSDARLEPCESTRTMIVWTNESMPRKSASVVAASRLLRSRCCGKCACCSRVVKACVGGVKEAKGQETTLSENQQQSFNNWSTPKFANDNVGS